MLLRPCHLFRLAVFAALVCAAWVMLPRSAAFAAPAMAVYRGDVAAGTGTPRKVELRLKADGTMSLISDMRNNKAPVTEDGSWNPVSVEQIDLVIERRDGVAIAPHTLHFVKKGDTLQTTAESGAQFGSAGLQLRQTRAAVAAPTAVAITGSAPAIGTWRWEGMVSSASRIDVDQPERYTLELQNGGKALVRADCNRGQAAYKLSGRAIAISVGGMSKTVCPAGSLSERFVKSLDAAVAQRVRGDNLFIDLPGDAGTMKFVRAR